VRVIRERFNADVRCSEYNCSYDVDFRVADYNNGRNSNYCNDRHDNWGNDNACHDSRNDYFTRNNGVNDTRYRTLVLSSIIIVYYEYVCYAADIDFLRCKFYTLIWTNDWSNHPDELCDFNDQETVTHFVLECPHWETCFAALVAWGSLRVTPTV